MWGWITALIEGLAKFIKTIFGRSGLEKIEVIEERSPISLEPGESIVFDDLGLRQRGTEGKDHLRNISSGPTGSAIGKQEDEGEDS